MAKRLFGNLALKARFCSETSVKFPRISKEDIEANWVLAKSLVTPLGKVLLNSVKSGKKSGYSSELKVGIIPKNLHVTAAKEISKSETVFIEEGEFRGILFKIVTGNPEIAEAARSTLTSSQTFEGGITVLACEKSVPQGAYFDKTKKLLVAGGVSDALLQEAINSL